MDFNIDNWCEEFKGLPTVPMDDNLCRVMMACMLGGVNRDVLEDMFIYKVIVARAEALGFEMEQNLIDFLSILCKSPGDSTMYLSLLKNEQGKGFRANMENFINMFPMGFPTQDVLGNLWDAQKQQGAFCGNALDMNQWERTE